MKTTISVIGACVGSFPGFSRAHPRLLEEAAKRLKEQEGGLLIDSFVARCGPALELVMTHARGPGDEEVLGLAGDLLRSCAEIATGMKLHGVDPDLSSDAVGGAAEMEFVERESEPVLLFMAAPARAGAWNFHLYRTFADPFTTPGLVRNPSMHDGFVFEVHDLVACRRALFRTPEESYDLLDCIGLPSRYAVRHVFSKESAIAASASIPPSAASPSGKGAASAPVLIVRSEAGFPAVGECLAPFTTPFFILGGLPGGNLAPLMPVAVCDAGCTVGDGPPRATCLGFQVSRGRLVGPADLFDDPAFDLIRRKTLELAETLRGQGPFAPHRLSLRNAEQQEARWEPIE
ncbi:MAG: fructose 1,6-bisphosphatase [Methanospirillum sp.]